MSPSMQLDLSCLDPPSLAAARKGAVSAAACHDEAAVGGVGVGGGVPASFPLPAVQDVRFFVSLFIWSANERRMIWAAGRTTGGSNSPAGAPAGREEKGPAFSMADRNSRASPHKHPLPLPLTHTAGLL